MKYKFLLILFICFFVFSCSSKKVEFKDSVNPSIEGNWIVLSIDNNPILNQKKPYLNFDSPERVSGNAGCNKFFAHYELNLNKIKIGPMRITRMACAPERHELEIKVLSYLNSAVKYHITLDDKLLLKLKDGRSLVLIKA